MLRTHYLLCILSLALGFAVFPSHAQEEKVDAPYLYYYSTIVNAFVIERADGTDSRILAQNVMPPNYNRIDEPLWSPSGKWMAWRGAVDGGLANSYFSGWIIRTDGSERLTILDQPLEATMDIQMMTWAEENDLLFVAEEIFPVHSVMRYRLIDAEKGTLTKASIETYVEDIDQLSYHWLPQEIGIVIYNPYPAINGQIKLVKLLTDGTVETLEYDAIRALGVSSEGQFSYITRDGQALVIESLLYGSTKRFALSGVSDFPIMGGSDQLLWMSDNRLALLYRQVGDSFQLWLIDPIQQDALLIDEDVALISKLNWHLDREYAEAIAWQPDGSLHFYVNSDGIYHLFNADTKEIRVLAHVPPYDNIEWSENGQQLLFMNRNSTNVYDLVSEQSTQVQLLLNPIPNPYLFEQSLFPSPDGKYIGTRHRRIYEVETIYYRDFDVHSAVSNSSTDVMNYRWHPTEPWTIVEANLTVAGCCGANAYTVLPMIYEQSSRELGIFYGVGAGWVPERVLANLAGGITAP